MDSSNLIRVGKSTWPQWVNCCAETDEMSSMWQCHCQDDVAHSYSDNLTLHDNTCNPSPACFFSFRSILLSFCGMRGEGNAGPWVIHFTRILNSLISNRPMNVTEIYQASEGNREHFIKQTVKPTSPKTYLSGFNILTWTTKAFHERYTCMRYMYKKISLPKYMYEVFLWYVR